MNAFQRWYGIVIRTGMKGLRERAEIDVEGVGAICVKKREQSEKSAQMRVLLLMRSFSIRSEHQERMKRRKTEIEMVRCAPTVRRKRANRSNARAAFDMARRNRATAMKDRWGAVM